MNSMKINEGERMRKVSGAREARAPESCQILPDHVASCAFFLARKIKRRTDDGGKQRKNDDDLSLIMMRRDIAAKMDAYGDKAVTCPDKVLEPRSSACPTPSATCSHSQCLAKSCLNSPQIISRHRTHSGTYADCIPMGQIESSSLGNPNARDSSDNLLGEYLLPFSVQRSASKTVPPRL